jgi:hypothetical protein
VRRTSINTVTSENHSRQSSHLKLAISLGVEWEEQTGGHYKDENVHSITIKPHLIMPTPKERMNQNYLQLLQEEE